MKVLISAGEASGDLYASRVVEALRARHPDAEFFGCDFVSTDFSLAYFGNTCWGRDGDFVQAIQPVYYQGAMKA